MSIDVLRERDRQARARAQLREDKREPSPQPIFGEPKKVDPSFEDETSRRIKNTLGDFTQVQRYLINDPKHLIGISRNIPGTALSSRLHQGSGSGSRQNTTSRTVNTNQANSEHVKKPVIHNGQHKSSSHSQIPPPSNKPSDHPVIKQKVEILCKPSSQPHLPSHQEQISSNLLSDSISTSSYPSIVINNISNSVININKSTGTQQVMPMTNGKIKSHKKATTVQSVKIVPPPHQVEVDNHVEVEKILREMKLSVPDPLTAIETPRTEETRFHFPIVEPIEHTDIKRPFLPEKPNCTGTSEPVKNSLSQFSLCEDLEVSDSDDDMGKKSKNVTQLLPQVQSPNDILDPPPPLLEAMSSSSGSSCSESEESSSESNDSDSSISSSGSQQESSRKPEKQRWGLLNFMDKKSGSPAFMGMDIVKDEAPSQHSALVSDKDNNFSLVDEDSVNCILGKCQDIKEYLQSPMAELFDLEETSRDKRKLSYPCDLLSPPRRSPKGPRTPPLPPKEEIEDEFHSDQHSKSPEPPSESKLGSCEFQDGKIKIRLTKVNNKKSSVKSKPKLHGEDTVDSIKSTKNCEEMKSSSQFPASSKTNASFVPSTESYGISPLQKTKDPSIKKEKSNKSYINDKKVKTTNSVKLEKESEIPKKNKESSKAAKCSTPEIKTNCLKKTLKLKEKSAERNNQERKEKEKKAKLKSKPYENVVKSDILSIDSEDSASSSVINSFSKSAADLGTSKVNKVAIKNEYKEKEDDSRIPKVTYSSPSRSNHQLPEKKSSNSVSSKSNNSVKSNSPIPKLKDKSSSRTSSKLKEPLKSSSKTSHKIKEKPKETNKSSQKLKDKAKETIKSPSSSVTDIINSVARGEFFSTKYEPVPKALDKAEKTLNSAPNLPFSHQNEVTLQNNRTSSDVQNAFLMSKTGVKTEPNIIKESPVHIVPELLSPIPHDNSSPAVIKVEESAIPSSLKVSINLLLLDRVPGLHAVEKLKHNKVRQRTERDKTQTLKSASETNHLWDSNNSTALKVKSEVIPDRSDELPKSSDLLSSQPHKRKADFPNSVNKKLKSSSQQPLEESKTITEDSPDVEKEEQKHDLKASKKSIERSSSCSSLSSFSSYQSQKSSKQSKKRSSMNDQAKHTDSSKRPKNTSTAKDNKEKDEKKVKEKKDFVPTTTNNNNASKEKDRTKMKDKLNDVIKKEKMNIDSGWEDGNVLSSQGSNRDDPLKYDSSKAAVKHEVKQEVIDESQNDRVTGGSCSYELQPPVHQENKRTVKHNSKQYSSIMDEGKKLKRQADKEKNKVLQTIKYLEALTKFILAGNVLEHSNNNDIENVQKLIKDTLNFSSVICREQNVLGSVESKLKVISLKCQSLLYLKLYSMHRAEVKELHSGVSDFLKSVHSNSSRLSSLSSPLPCNHPSRLSQPSPYQPRIGGAGGVPSPHSPTPSPAGSVASVGSQSSGYSSGDLNGSHARPIHTPTTSFQPCSGQLQSSHTQQSSATVTVPQHVLDMLQQEHMHLHNLHMCHELWDQSEHIITHSQIKDFFNTMNDKFGHLSLHSSLGCLVSYVNKALAHIKESINH